MNNYKRYFNIVFLSLVMLSCTSVAIAQKEYAIEQVSSINMGDGRMLYRDLKNEQPLNGQHRIIDGYHSAYIQAEFKDGFYNGEYKAYEYNKLTKEGKYKEGLKHGIFKEYYSSGEKVKLETSYANGKLDGWRKSYYTDGNIEREQHFKEGKEHGIERNYDNNGELRRECNYSNGEYDGKQMILYRGNMGDVVERFNYRNGKQEGEFSQTYLTGVPHILGQYTAGKKSGRWITILENSDTLKIETFNAGREEGQQVVFNSETGLREYEDQLKNDKRNGLCKEYDPKTGEVICEAEYVNGKKHGKVKMLVADNRSDYWETYVYVNGFQSGPFESHFIKNDRLREKGTYRNGRKVGRWALYDINGKLLREWDETN